MLNIALLLAAISAVESGDNDLAVGKRGEVSRYQMLPAVWSRYNRHFGKSAPWHDPQIAVIVAGSHIRWLQSQLPGALKDDPGVIILCWKKGATGAKKLLYNTNLAPPKTQDYCERVWNLYREKLRSQ